MDVLNSKFYELFGAGEKPQKFFCPGRVNLIGEHIDYLGGDVLPCAISLGITGLLRKNGTDQIRLYSADFGEITEYASTELPKTKTESWTDYVIGVALHLLKSGVPLGGFDMLVESSLPKGSGLSSSAALEVLVYYALSMLFADEEPNRKQMALDCQQIENEFIGVNCGIMDQFAVANGLAGQALQLNCRTLEFKPVPIKLNGHSLLIINSNKPRALAESAYNQRVKECNLALKILQRKNPSIQQLVDAEKAELISINDAILHKRAKHAITENMRVQESASALAANDLKRFGQLMNESHKSLSVDFEVSCSELDFIAEFLQQEEDCLGARMTGAGFGGCCVALVSTCSIESISERLESIYLKKFGLEASFYSCKPFAGVHMLMND